jgi:hypothetical protein
METWRQGGQPLIAAVVVWKGNKWQQGGQPLVIILVWKGNTQRQGGQPLIVVVMSLPAFYTDLTLEKKN